MQENMHVVISVKDFKAIVTHAETLRGAISAHFSFPTRPLQFCYQNSGMHCEFTLMTTGDYRGASSTPNPQFISTRSSSRQPSVAPVAAPSRSVSEMPPPARPAASKPLGSQRERVPAQGQAVQRPAEDPDLDPESLFVPGRDDDNTWDPPNYEQDEEEEMLGWDASNENPSASFHPTFRDSGTVARPQEKRQAPAYASQEGLEPTQRLSQLHGMFD
jgi:cell cycle checkpoint control protein RAD9A